jgi:uncharacterized membrane protein
MNAAIGVYDSHDKALSAVKELKDAGYPVKRISIIGKANVEEVDEKLNVQPKNPLHVEGVGIGTALGTAVGILTGVGLFAIPGFGFLYGAGALVGAIAGFDFGLIGGGIASVFTTLGVEDEATQKYQDHLAAGKYLLVVQGDNDEVTKAIKILEEHGQHTYVAAH